MMDAGVSNNIADASATMLNQMVFDILMSGDKGVDINALSKVVARLRIGDHRAKELEMKIADYEREAAERQAKVDALKAKAQKAKDGGGLTDDARAIVDELILGL